MSRHGKSGQAAGYGPSGPQGGYGPSSQGQQPIGYGPNHWNYDKDLPQPVDDTWDRGEQFDGNLQEALRSIG